MSIRVTIIAMALSLTASGTAARAQDSSEVVAELERLSERGNGEAAYHLGMAYHLGLDGIQQDSRRAFEYFVVAAQAGDPLGAYKVGCFYAGQGEGVVAPNPEEALRYKLIAAEEGYALAQQEVAQHYFRDGDFERALHWIEAAAAQGDLASLSALAAIYAGKIEIPDVSTDNVKAIYYAVLVANIMASEIPDFAIGDVVMAVREDLGATAEEATRAEAMAAEWHAAPTELTLKADAGQSAAEQLVRGI